MLTRNINPYEPLNHSHEITVLIQKGCEMEGRLQFEGTARIDGVFKGEIFTPDVIIIGPTAQVNGQITCDVAIILGNFEGSILATQKVEIAKSANVKAEVKTVTLQVDEGALFEGKMKMLMDAPE